MKSKCPRCSYFSVTAQDIEALSDSALLVKLENRIQLRCEHCGWMGCTNVCLDQTATDNAGVVVGEPPMQHDLFPERKPYMSRPGLAIDDYDT